MYEGIFVSTNAFVDRRPDSIFGSMTALPEVAIELSAVDADEAGCISFSKRLYAEGTKVALHNYFPIPDEPFVLNLAARDDALRRRSIDFCRRALELSSDIEADHYAVHPGFAIDFEPSDLGNPERQAILAGKGGVSPFDEFSSRVIDSLVELSEYGKSLGVALLAENNVVSPHSGSEGSRMIPMGHPNELQLLVDAGIPLLFDVAHAKVSATTFGESPLTWFEELSGHIAGLHVSDNDGFKDTGEGFGEDVWFADLLRSESSLPVTLEVNRKSDREICDHLERIAKWRS